MSWERVFRPLPFALLAVVAGLTIGVAAAVEPLLAVAAVVSVPLAIWLVARPDLLPPALVVVVFIEGLALGDVQISRAMGALAALILILILITNYNLVRIPSKAVLLVTGAYAFWAFSSLLWSTNTGFVTDSYSGTTYALASLALSITFMLVCALLIERREELRRVVATIWLMAVIVGIVAIVEYASGSSRSVGYTGDANFFAATQVVALPIAVAFATTASRGRTRTMAFVGTAVIAGSILTSLSRGGILALLGILLLLAIQPARTFFRSPSQKRMALVAAVLGATTMLALSYADLKDRTSSAFNLQDGASGRTFLWHAAADGWEEHPLLGLGYGAFPPQSNGLLLRSPETDLSTYRLRSTGQVVHNAYLGSLTELGPVGLLLFVSLLAVTFTTLRSVTRRADVEGDAFLATVARAMIVALCGYALTSLFLSTETDRALWILLGISVALPRLLPRPDTQPG
jgi:O-antigen ligase